VNTPQAKAGVNFLVNGFKQGYIPKAALTYKEEESRRAFQEGNLIFERNWAYTYAKFNATDGSSKVNGKFGVAPIPGLTGPGTSTLGGHDLAISKFTKNKLTALNFIKFITGEVEQNNNLQATSQELETALEELQSTNEELETTNQELQSTNEELETTNQELQSTNEELEMMNEELESTNDELQAVNDEDTGGMAKAAASRGLPNYMVNSYGGDSFGLGQVCSNSHYVGSWYLDPAGWGPVCPMAGRGPVWPTAGWGPVPVTAGCGPVWPDRAGRVRLGRVRPIGPVVRLAGGGVCGPPGRAAVSSPDRSTASASRARASP